MVITKITKGGDYKLRVSFSGRYYTTGCMDTNNKMQSRGMRVIELW